MKIKRFNNLWTMGLILIIAIYSVYFIVKMVNPAFIIGITELPGVVEFGNFVDSNQWAYYLFNGLISFLVYYIYCCACCRKKSLNYKDCTLILFFVILGYVFYAVMPMFATPFNHVSFILIPSIILFLDKADDMKYMKSTTFCFATHILLQYVQSEIKDISTMITYPNSATFTILMIDIFIWLIGLYLFYNKGGNKNG